MISTFTAFFDANVFYGSRLRSLMLYAAQTKLFRARWSERIHDEWTRNLLLNRPELSVEKLAEVRRLMNAAVPDCVVTGFEPLIEGIDLPDPDDRHVVAAAIVARADVIVTFNQKDFPEEALEPFHLHTEHPDDFLLDAFGLGPDEMSEQIICDYLHYRNPKITFRDYRASLEKAGTPRFARFIEPLEVLVPPIDG